MNINWHDPELYYFLTLLTGIAALLAVIYDTQMSVPLRTLLRHDAMFRAESAFGGFWSVSLIFSLRVGRTETR